MDANETVEALGAQPLLDLLDTIGGWNISGNFTIERWSLQNSMHILQNVYNMGGLFSWAVNEDDRNSTRYVIQVVLNRAINEKHLFSLRIMLLFFLFLKIDQGGLTLPTADNYLNVTEHGKVLTAYLEYMTKVRNRVFVGTKKAP